MLVRQDPKQQMKTGLLVAVISYNAVSQAVAQRPFGSSEARLHLALIEM